MDADGSVDRTWANKRRLQLVEISEYFRYVFFKFSPISLTTTTSRNDEHERASHERRRDEYKPEECRCDAVIREHYNDDHIPNNVRIEYASFDDRCRHLDI